MHTNLFVLISVALGSSAITYGIAYLLHKRKVDEYSNLNEAIQKTGQIVESLKQKRLSLHQQVVTKTKQAKEALLELKKRIKSNRSHLKMTNLLFPKKR